MKIAYFYLTSEGKVLINRIKSQFDGDIFEKEKFKEKVEYAFSRYDYLVFVMATGIVVRTIAPLLKDKTQDPAVIVLDQKGAYCISLLSGHIGGANKFAIKIADYIKGQAVITTATDVTGVYAFDLFAKKHNLYIENIENLKYISSALIEKQEIDVITPHEIQGAFGDNVCVVSEFRDKTSVVIDSQLSISTKYPVLYLRPKCMVLGVGCKKNTNSDYFEKCIIDFLNKQNISIHSIKSISTIYLKENEKCILDFCDKYDIPLVIASIEEINKYADCFEQSEYVKKVTGAFSVAEGSSYVISGLGKIICKKTKYNGVTLALSRERLVFDTIY